MFEFSMLVFVFCLAYPFLWGLSIASRRGLPGYRKYLIKKIVATVVFILPVTVGICLMYWYASSQPYQSGWMWGGITLIAVFAIQMCEFFFRPEGYRDMTRNWGDSLYCTGPKIGWVIFFGKVTFWTGDQIPRQWYHHFIGGLAIRHLKVKGPDGRVLTGKLVFKTTDHITHQDFANDVPQIYQYMLSLAQDLMHRKADPDAIKETLLVASFGRRIIREVQSLKLFLPPVELVPKPAAV